MFYGLFTALAGLTGWLIARTLPAHHSNAVDTNPDRSEQRSFIRFAALIGAVVGAHASHALAAHIGWVHGEQAQPAVATAPFAISPAVLNWSGRSVLGGLLGGWLMLELAKIISGLRSTTGPGLAAPLAGALAIGRIGCVFAGCCAGIEYHGWGHSWLCLHDGEHVPHLAAPLFDALFHALACCWLWRRARSGQAHDGDLVGYLCLIGAERFLLEYIRQHPPALVGLTYYQLLALALMLCAGVCSWLRLRRRQHALITAEPE